MARTPRGDDVRDPRALRPPGSPAALHRGDPRGGRRTGRHRLRRPDREGGGRGPGILRDGGVEVEFAAGAEATAARLLNQPFRKHARTGLPLVTLKLAMSLDGATATAPGDSPWISGERSRELVHRWRAESDAIAVGIGTVLADDPLLTARTEGDPRQPLRVVFDRRPAFRSTRSSSRRPMSRRCSSSPRPMRRNRRRSA